MKIRKLLVLLGTVALGAHLLSGTADAAKKKCKKLCHDIKVGCLTEAKTAFPCKTVPKADKKTCHSGFKAARKACGTEFAATIQKCKASTATDTCSPSGAFIGLD